MMEKCKFCKTDDLFSAFFDEDGLANDGSTGDSYRTVCQSCGRFQDETPNEKLSWVLQAQRKARAARRVRMYGFDPEET